MKRSYLLLGLLLILVFFQSRAQQVLTENFQYSGGTSLVSDGWSLATGGSSPLVTTSGLSYPGYILSGVGQATALNTTGQGVCKDGAYNVATGSVYTSFMLSVTSANATGDYFVSLLPLGARGLNTSFGRVYVKSAGSGYFKLGVAQFGTVTWDYADSFSVGPTIMVVLKYKFTSGTGYDSCSLFAFSSGFPSTEPATPGVVSTNSINNPTGLGCIALRASSTSPTCIVDGIRMGQTWSDLNAPTSNPCPAPASPALTPLSGTIATVTWTKPAAYNGSAYVTLVFIKAGASIGVATPTALPSTYTANSVFGLGTSYQNDLSAKCVYNDTNTSINITGLTQGVRYYVMIYNYRKTDSVYSSATLVNNVMPVTAPGAITALTFTATGQTTSNVTWILPSGFNSFNNSILIFAKAASAITQGTPNMSPANIVAGSSFGTGSTFQNDANAFCIYNGTSLAVSLTGLSAGTTYYLLAYAVNNSDSSYSTPATASGITNSPPPTAVSGLAFTASGSSTANITWTKPSNYSNNIFTTLVFIKQNTAVIQGTPTFNPVKYVSNTVYGTGSVYQNDPAAFCVYKGDSNIVSITGLTANTNYNVLVYVVRDIDSLYSTSSTATGITQAPPPNPATNGLFTAVNTAAARITWTSPGGGLGNTILIFAKVGSPINLGNPNQAANTYTALTNYPFGTAFQNDAYATCIFRGNGNTLNITGLTQNTTYYFAIFVVNINANYSTADTFSGTIIPPTDVTNLMFLGTDTNTATITWTRPAGYSNAANQTLVFVEQGGPVNKGTPTWSPNRYTANANYGLGTGYQNDAAAVCVYNGDSNAVNLTGLNHIAPYYVLVLVVRANDSAYSSPGATANGSVLTAPPPPPSDVSNVGVTGMSQTSAKITWTKPPGYLNSVYTTMVFVKKNLSITSSKPTKPVTYYTSNPNFGTGTTYQFDPLAHCVYKGDTDFVNLTNIVNNGTYYVLVWVIRDVDSVYSPNGATASGTALPTPPPPPDVTGVTFSGLTTSAANISWQKPSGYDNANMTTLVFVKQASLITQGSPTKDISFYNPNAVFGSGTSYQNDALARCVFKGDTNFVNITNLNNTSTYYVLVYVVHDIDSAYSTSGATGSGMALPSPPPPPTDVTNLTFNGTSTTSANIAWTKPSGYNNSIHSTLVFVKQSSSVNAGTPSMAPGGYSSNAFFGLGSSYQNDASAKCVFKGDTNFVNIGNLYNGTPYYVLVYVVTDYDSVYSTNGNTVSGSSLPTPPAPKFYTISQVNHVNVITGVPDSTGVHAGIRGIVYGFNLRPPGVEFLIRDNTGGITVSSLSSTFGYTVTQGDSVEIQGVIGSNRGQLNIGTLDTLKLLGTGKPIKTPSVVTSLSETTENDLVQIYNLQFINKPSGNVWPSNVNMRCVRVGSTDTINVFIPATCLLVGQAIPTTPAFTLTGMGRQNSSSTAAPFAFDGYYMIPRTLSDVISVNIFSNFSLSSPSNNASIRAENNLATVNYFRWSKSNLNIGFDSVKYLFQLDTINGNFTNPKVNLTVGDTFTSFTNNALLNLIAVRDVTFTGKWRVIASAATVAPNVKNSDSIFFVNITIGYFSGINQPAGHPISFLIYPNPGTGLFNIQSDETITKVDVTDVTGRKVYSTGIDSKTTVIDGSGWTNGMYYIRVETENGSAVKRIIKF